MATSVEQLQKAMINKGYLYATAQADTTRDDKKRKIQVNYHVNAGVQYITDSIHYEFPNNEFKNLISQDSSRYIIKPGTPLDRSLLELERERIASLLKNNGYYGFSKEFVTFNADTTQGSNKVNLTLTVNPSYANPTGSILTHEKYYIQDIRFITDFNPSL